MLHRPQILHINGVQSGGPSVEQQRVIDMLHLVFSQGLQSEEIAVGRMYCERHNEYSGTMAGSGGVLDWLSGYELQENGFALRSLNVLVL
jgi:hypothetical protein